MSAPVFEITVDDVEVSEVYNDDRDGNSARPWIVSVRVPDSKPRNGKKFFRHVLRIRSGRRDHAEEIFNFLCDELEKETPPSIQEFTSMVLEIQSGTNVMARRASANAHQKEMENA